MMNEPITNKKLYSNDVVIENYNNIAFTSVRQKIKIYSKKFLWVLVIKWSYAIKRIFDVFVSISLLSLLFPFLLIVMMLIKYDSRGPIFFSQTRVGRWGVSFKMWKFRSMHVDAEARMKELLQSNEMQGGVIFKMKNDPRITRVGKFLRKYSIDEIPQLWNVLVGNMSIVGPRPPLPSEVENYTLMDRQRLNVIPGLTCFWQISGRSDIPFEQQVKLDIEYIQSQSIFQDICILLKTIPAVFLGSGAY